MMGQTYPICACSDTNHARHSIGSQYVLLQLKTIVFKVTLEKLVGKLRKFKRHRLEKFPKPFLSRS